MKRLTMTEYRALSHAEQWCYWRALARRRRWLDKRPPTLSPAVLTGIVERVIARKDELR